MRSRDGPEVDVEQAFEIVFMCDGREIYLRVAIRWEAGGCGSEDWQVTEQPVVRRARKVAEEATVEVEAVGMVGCVGDGEAEEEDRN